MPTRLIREGILDSDAVDQLDAPAEVFYRRLMSKVDDHGLFDARISILCSGLFPLRCKTMRETDISRWLAACEKAGLIALYQSKGKPFGQMLNTQWEARSKPKFPVPPWHGDCYPQVACADDCKQPETPVSLDVDVVGVVVAEKQKTLAPSQGRFGEFWEAWPKNERKQDKKACVAKWKLHNFDALADVILADIALKLQTQKWREGFIEAPEVYLNNRRWEDGVTPEGPRVLNGSGEIKQWHESATGIAEKGAAYGLREADFPHFPAFKAAVYAAAGHIPPRTH